MATFPVCLTIRPENAVITKKIKLTVHHSGNSRVDAEGVWCPPGGAVKRGVDLKASIDRDLPVTPIFSNLGYDRIGPAKTYLKDTTVLADRYAFIQVALKGQLSTHMSRTSRVDLNIEITDLFKDLGTRYPNLRQIEDCVGCISALLEERFGLPRGEFVDVSKAPAKPLYDELSACIGAIEQAPDLGDPFPNLLAKLPFLDREQLGQVSRILEPYMKGDGDATRKARNMLEGLTRISEVEVITLEMTAPNLLERAASAAASAVASLLTATWGAFRGED